MLEHPVRQFFISQWIVNLVKNFIMYTEPEIFEIVNRLVKIYLESYPEDQEGLERFLRWAHAQYGYKYGNS
jgi:hypothetical protein